MNIYLKHVEPLGFKGSGLFSPKWQSAYHRVDDITRSVIIVTNHTPQTVSLFTMDKGQFKAFQDGKLSLVPPQCCNPSGRPSLYASSVIFSGTIMNIKHLHFLIAEAERTAYLGMSSAFWKRYGRAIHRLRSKYCVGLDMVPGLPKKRLQEIERGSRVSSEEIVRLADAHCTTPNGYLNEVAQTLKML